MLDKNIAFIGAGNMASSLIHGLLATGIGAQQIMAADIDSKRLQSLQTRCQIRIADHDRAAAEADVLVLAVKPQVMAEVCHALAPRIDNPDCLILSVAAGISLQSLEQWLGNKRAIVRSMPNTPALVGRGATALFANANATASQRALAESITDAVGISCWLEQESDMDIVTALSGSGPAYFFLLIEAMQAAAIDMGLSPELARRLSVQTALGAGQLASSEADNGVNADELRRRVTSPGGTTEQALASFAADNFGAAVTSAMAAARRRSAELAAAASNQNPTSTTNQSE